MVGSSSLDGNVFRVQSKFIIFTFTDYRQGSVIKYFDSFFKNFVSFFEFQVMLEAGDDLEGVVRRIAHNMNTLCNWGRCFIRNENARPLLFIFVFFQNFKIFKFFTSAARILILRK